MRPCRGRLPHTSRGFTLAEMMVAMAVSMIVLLAIYLVMTAGERSWQTNDASVDVQENVRQGLRAITQELRESGRVDATAYVLIGGGNDEIVFQVPVDADAGTAAFDLDGGGNIVWGAEGTADYAIDYALDGTQLVRQVVDTLSFAASDVGDPRVVANYIASVTFNPVPASGDILGVEVVLRAEREALTQHDVASEQREQVSLRNVYE